MNGPPEAVEGECNATLEIGDDYGDNTATMRCPLPAGHEGLHCEEYGEDDEETGKVKITWEKDGRDFCAVCNVHIASPSAWHWVYDEEANDDDMLCEKCYKAYKKKVKEDGTETEEENT
jgi:hypothetical protein